MVLPDFGAVLLIAIALTAIFDRYFAAPGERRKLWSFFTVILLASWLGGTFAPPFGPTAWGVSWMRFLGVAIIAGLLLGSWRRRR